MALEDIPPFAKIAGIVLGLAVLGIFLKCASTSSDPVSSACNGLPMGSINPCIDRARKCSGTEEVARACIQKAVEDSTPK